MGRASMFIKIDGIPGESEDDTHKDWIDVLSWSWGMSQSANTHRGGGGGQAVASVSDLSFVKWVDKSTPALMFNSLAGKHINKAQLVCTKAGGDSKPINYITIKMTDVIVSSVSEGGSSGEDGLTESVTLNFAKVEYQYIVQTKDGGEGAKPNVEWDVKAGKGSVS